MVVGAFPAAKLGSLLLKQISKPIANVVKAQAKNSPVFRKYVCMPPAQFYNWCEIKAKMWILNLGKPVNIPVLNEQMAIDLGANLLGEGIIFLIAAGILINEYTRSYRKEAAKEEKRIQEMELLQRTVQELFFAHEKQATQIRELTRVIYDLEGRVVQKPWVPKKNKDEGTPPSPPPVIVSEPILTLEEVETIGSENLEKQETRMQEMANTSLLMKAVNELEEDLFQSDNRTTRDVGIVTTALNFLYKDVYRLQLTM